MQRHRRISHDRQQLTGEKVPFFMITGYEVSTEEKTVTVTFLYFFHGIYLLTMLWVTFRFGILYRDTTKPGTSKKYHDEYPRDFGPQIAYTVS